MSTLFPPINGADCPDPTTPLGALNEFYRAFNGRDLALMQQNWQPDECVLDNPLGGIRRGWGEIESLYRKLFTGKARVWVEFYDYCLHTGHELFCAAGRERGLFEKQGRRIELAIRTSRVYRFDGRRWRQIHHHGSIDDAGLLTTYLDAVLS
jgi:hypothetical protein